MIEALKTLKETPLPIVLVIGGLIFLLIPFIQKIQAKEVGVETTNQLGAGLIGFMLLVIGVGLYIVPSGTMVSSLPTETPPQVIQPTELPTITPILASPPVLQPTVSIIPTATLQRIIPTASPVKVDVVGDNLVQNPGFESGMYSGGWEWGLPTVNIQSGHESSSALCSKQELQASQNVGWVGFHQNVPVSGNQKYTLSAWVKFQTASQVHIKILWFDSNFAEIGNNTFIMGGTDGTSDWSQHGGVANSPANAVRARLAFWHGVKVGDINVPNSFMCIDDVFFATIQ